jgi:hypothetical protein
MKTFSMIPIPPTASRIHAFFFKPAAAMRRIIHSKANPAIATLIRFSLPRQAQDSGLRGPIKAPWRSGRGKSKLRGGMVAILAKKEKMRIRDDLIGVDVAAMTIRQGHLKREIQRFTD